MFEEQVNGKCPVETVIKLLGGKYDFTKYGRVLSVAEMFPGTITRSMQVDFFYQFLKRSPNSPQWYGYAGRNGFAVKRDYFLFQIFRLTIRIKATGRE